MNFHPPIKPVDNQLSDPPISPKPTITHIDWVELVRQSRAATKHLLVRLDRDEAARGRASMQRLGYALYKRAHAEFDDVYAVEPCRVRRYSKR